MSVSVMSQVWESSALGGTELLLLLAIADHANDSGTAWPSVGALARKIRMSERNTHYLLKKIAKSGEIVIEKSKGPKGCNLFRVKSLQGANLSGVQPVALGGAMDGAKGVQPIAPEPSVNHQGTTKPMPATAGPPLCPVDKIVEAYHRLMPDNPRCKMLSTARRGAIKARWSEAAKLTCSPFGYETTSDGLNAWEEFFAICAESIFLTGRATPQPGKPPFLADIDFLFSPRGFAGCIEDKYHREAA